MKIVLASKSKVRKDILTEHNIDCEVIQSNVDEKFRGRVMSINQLSWGSAALGALMVGYLAEIISIKFD